MVTIGDILSTKVVICHQKVIGLVRTFSLYILTWQKFQFLLANDVNHRRDQPLLRRHRDVLLYWALEL